MLTGKRLELSLPSRIKEPVDHAGPSQLLAVLKVYPKFMMMISRASQSNNCWTVPTSHGEISAAMVDKCITLLPLSGTMVFVTQKITSNTQPKEALAPIKQVPIRSAPIPRSQTAMIWPTPSPEDQYQSQSMPPTGVPIQVVSLITVKPSWTTVYFWQAQQTTTG